MDINIVSVADNSVKLWVVAPFGITPVWRIIGNDLSAIDAARVAQKKRKSIVVTKKAAHLMEGKNIYHTSFYQNRVYIGPNVFEV